MFQAGATRIGIHVGVPKGTNKNITKTQIVLGSSGGKYYKCSHISLIFLWKILRNIVSLEISGGKYYTKVVFLLNLLVENNTKTQIDLGIFWWKRLQKLVYSLTFRVNIL